MLRKSIETGGGQLNLGAPAPAKEYVCKECVLTFGNYHDFVEQKGGFGPSTPEHKMGIGNLFKMETFIF
jgi:hypothetical protein